MIHRLASHRTASAFSRLTASRGDFGSGLPSPAPDHLRPWFGELSAALLTTLLLWLACSSSAPSVPSSGLATVAVTLPDGATIRTELALTTEQQAAGLMFRDELPADRGMLFIFPNVQPRTFWMYRTRIPLDIIWMDENRRIVEISPKTPPCPSESSRDCPSYGGNADSQYVLELAAGQAAAHGLKLGDQLSF